MSPVPRSPCRTRPLQSGRGPVRWVFGCVLLAALGVTGCRASRPQPAETVFAGELSGSPFDTDIAALGSPDFVLRSQAAERLVRAGTASLEALGRAGDRPTPGPGSPQESTTAPVLTAILADATDAEVQTLLTSAHPNLRVAAARETGRRGAWTPVAQLIERLGDQEPAVRAAAQAALQRITGELSDPVVAGHTGQDLSAAKRADRWRLWWRQAGRARAEAAHEPRGS